MMNYSIREMRASYWSCFTLLLFTLGAFDASAQLIVHNKLEKNVIVGMHAISEGFNAKDPVSGDVTRESTTYFEPYAGYFFNRNFGFGPVMRYNRFRSSVAEDYDHFEAGGFARYFVPIGLNPDKGISLLLLAEVSCRVANYRQLSSLDIVHLDGFDHVMYTVTPIGAQIEIWKGLYGELSTDWVIHTSSYQQFNLRLGVEYHFGNQKLER